MGNLRKLKRDMRRKAAKHDIGSMEAEIITASKKVEDLLRAEQKEMADKIFEEQVKHQTQAMSLAMYYFFGIQLHRVFGFGAKRLLKLFEAVDGEMSRYISGEVDTTDLERRLYEETGIDYRT